jgi:hypothetical protein
MEYAQQFVQAMTFTCHVRTLLMHLPEVSISTLLHAYERKFMCAHAVWFPIISTSILEYALIVD